MSCPVNTGSGSLGKFLLSSEPRPYLCAKQSLDVQPKLVPAQTTSRLQCIQPSFARKPARAGPCAKLILSCVFLYAQIINSLANHGLLMTKQSNVWASPPGCANLCNDGYHSWGNVTPRLSLAGVLSRTKHTTEHKTSSVASNMPPNKAAESLTKLEGLTRGYFFLFSDRIYAISFV